MSEYSIEHWILGPAASGQLPSSLAGAAGADLESWLFGYSDLGSVVGSVRWGVPLVNKIRRKFDIL